MAPSDLANFLAGGAPGGENATSPSVSDGNDDPGGAPGVPSFDSPSFDPQSFDPADLASADGGPVILNETFEIAVEEALPELSGMTATAYAARSLAQPGDKFFAAVVQSGLPIRADIIGSLRGLEQPAVMRLVDWGTVFFPPLQVHQPVVIFERPAGGRLVKSIDQRRAPMTEDQVTRFVIGPLLSALQELKLRRVGHGAINPANLMLRDGGSGVQLGDCVTGPAGYAQPVLFETIERGMAQPSGRGAPTTADDLYALGVTLLHLLLGRRPLGDLDGRLVVDAKVEKGSFSALIGDARLPLSVLEPLRGLLMDDPAQRWTLDDLDLWASGRRLSPKQSPPPKKAPRPIRFSGRDYWDPRTVGIAMTASPGPAGGLIENGDLDTWIRRSLDDERMADRVADGARASMDGRGGSGEDRRITRVTMALDPPAPIRYRDKAVLPEGVGAALAEAVVSDSGVQEIAEIIAAQLPMSWVNVQDTFRPELVPIVKKFDMIRSHLDKVAPGFGVERCLYELNPAMPCLSPLLAGRYILDLPRMLRALEEIAGRADRPADPIDRHIAAFVASRHTGLNDRALFALAGEEGSHQRGLAVLDILMEVQQITKVRPLPNLCGWLAKLLEPAVEQFNSRTLRQRMAEELSRQTETGLFRNLFALVRNSGLVKRDQAGFRAAQRHHSVAETVIAARERELSKASLAGGEIGRQVAAVAASLMSAVVLVAIVLIQAG